MLWSDGKMSSFCILVDTIFCIQFTTDYFFEEYYQKKSSIYVGEQRSSLILDEWFVFVYLSVSIFTIVSIAHHPHYRQNSAFCKSNGIVLFFLVLRLLSGSFFPLNEV